jgi:hypothetical protein
MAQFDLRLAHADGGGFLGDGFGDELLAGGFLLGRGLIGLGEDDLLLGLQFGAWRDASAAVVTA